MTQQAPQTKTADKSTEQSPSQPGRIVPTVKNSLGAYSNPAAVNARLNFLAREAAREAHLVSPSTSVARLPPGTSVALSAVYIDVENETYNVSGKRGLSKPALDKIAGAAGLSWDPFLSRRKDDGRDPCYCAWEAVCRVRQLDGVEIILTGSVELDLRDGSPTVDALASRAKDGRSAWKQLRDMRMFITRHAESKAKLRAIRTLGIRSSYSIEELTERPFVVARLMWTGESDDPELRKLFALKTADAFLGARSAIYGGPTHVGLPAPSAAPPPMLALADDELGFDDNLDPEPAPVATSAPSEPKVQDQPTHTAGNAGSEEKL